MERQDQVTRDPVDQRRKAINDELMIDEDQLYAGPQGQLRQWFDESTIATNADFMIVARDGFDDTLFPVYVNPGAFRGAQNTTETARGLEAAGDKVMEIYDLHAPREPQIRALRSWNNEQTRESTDATARGRDKDQQASRRSVGRKSLAIGTPPGMVQDSVAEMADPDVISAAVGGFTGGFAAGAQEAAEPVAPRSNVVMNPAHLARLEVLDSRRNDSLENADGHYGR